MSDALAVPDWRSHVAADHRQPEEWVNRYIDLPYSVRGRGPESFDCWGLVREIYRTEFGIDLPSFAHCYDGHLDRERIVHKIQEAVTGWIAVATPEPGDAVWMWTEDEHEPAHIALYVGGGRALTAYTSGSCLIDLRRKHWARHVVGFYRPRLDWVADDSRPFMTPSESVRVIAPENSLSRNKLERCYPLGETVADYLNHIAPLCKGSGRAVVLIGGTRIPQELWSRTKPKAGTDIRIEYMPEGGALPGLLPFLTLDREEFVMGLGLTLGIVGLFGGALGAAISILGTAALSVTGALGQTSTPDETKTSKEASATLRGVGNSTRPFDPIPVVFGRHRIFPAFCAPPYTFVNGGKQWVRAGFAFQGRYHITNITVGDVEIETIEGASVSVREGGSVLADYAAETDVARGSGAKPIHHWRMGTLGPIADRKSASSLTVQGANHTLVPGLVLLDSTADQASQFGADTVAYTTAQVIPASEPFTISFVFQTSSIADGTTLLQIGIPASLIVDFAVDELRITYVPTGETQNMLIRLDGTTVHHFALWIYLGTVRVQVDGGQSRKTFHVTSPLMNPGLVIGGQWDGATVTHALAGKYDEVIVWDDRLMHSDIWAEYYRSRGINPLTPNDNTRGGSDAFFANTQTEVTVNRAFPTMTWAEGSQSTYHTVALPGSPTSFSLTIHHFGIFRINDSGRNHPYSYRLEIEYRDSNLGAPVWQLATAASGGSGAVPPVTLEPGALFVAGQRRDPFLRQYQFYLPYASTGWEVRMRRIETEGEEQRPGHSQTAVVFADAVWESVRGIENSSPLNRKGLATVVVELPVEEIGGNLGRISMIAECVIPIYDASGNVTEYARSRNPADHALWALLSHVDPALIINPRPLAATDVDFAEFAALRQFAADNDMNHDCVLDVFDNWFLFVNRLLRTARAQLDFTEDGTWGVVIDQQKDTRSLMLTPRNSRGFTLTRTFVDQYHAKRARFLDETRGWMENQRTVYADGYDATTANKFQEIDLTQEGITHPDQVYRHVRAEIKANELIRELGTVEMGLGHHLARRGDRVGYAHPVAVVGKAWGRIIHIFTKPDAATIYTGVLLDCEMVYEDGTEYGMDATLMNGTGVNIALANRALDTGGAIRSNRFDFEAELDSTAIPLEVGVLCAIGVRQYETGDALVLGKTPHSDMGATLTLVPYQPAIYAAAEEPAPPFDPQITLPGPVIIAKPTRPTIQQIASDESVMVVTPAGVLLPRIVIAYALELMSSRIPVVRVEAQYRLSPGSLDADGHAVGGSEWIDLPPGPPSNGRFIITDVIEGAPYDVRLKTVGENGSDSLWEYRYGHLVVGRSTPPPDPLNLRLELLTELRWDLSGPVPVDLDGFLVRMHAGSRTDWESATPLHEMVIRDRFFKIPSIGGGERTFLVKTVDAAGNESTGLAYLTTTVTDPATTNVVLSIDHKAAGFTGMKVGCSVVGGDLVANTIPTDFWSGADTEPFWGPDGYFYWDASYTEMVYEFSVAHSANHPDGEIFLNATLDGPASVVFKRVGQGYFVPFPGRALVSSGETLIFRIIIAAGRIQGAITRLVAVIDVPDVTEIFTAFVVPSVGEVRIPITKTYHVITSVQATIYQAVDNLPRTFEIIDHGTGTPLITAGPSVVVKQANVANLRLSGTVDIRVLGF